MHHHCNALHNVLFVQYHFLATERGGTWPHTSQLWYHSTYFCVLQTLNLWFSLNYTPVSTTECWRFMPQFLSEYMGILLSPCIVYRAILNTGGSYCTMCALCTAVCSTVLHSVFHFTAVCSTVFCFTAVKTAAAVCIASARGHCTVLRSVSYLLFLVLCSLYILLKTRPRSPWHVGPLTSEPSPGPSAPSGHLDHIWNTSYSY